ncbi:MAG: flp pilus-assembly TadE/G-like family protein [Pseudonocardia sp.]|nr:flp pilus-assembly TadE/G-like family protein [Pseudonocardia sp.]
MSRPRRRSAALAGHLDAGFATVSTAGAVAVVVALAVVGLQLATATAGRHRAEAAADLASLAAASHAADGESVACAYAARISAEMAGRLVSCRLSGWEVTVEVAVLTSSLMSEGGEMHGKARAGPAVG